MGDIEHVGWFFVILLPVLIAIITFCMHYVTKPMVELKAILTRLCDKMEYFTERENTQDKRLDAHGERLDKMEIELNRHDVDIENLKKRK